MLTLAPPINMNPYWLGAHPSYTLSKYGMTLLSLGWAAEYADAGIAFNCLWPQTYIATAALSNMARWPEHDVLVSQPGDHGGRRVEILRRPAADTSGNCYIDSDVLTASGVEDLSRYGGGDNPRLDIFLDSL